MNCNMVNKFEFEWRLVYTANNSDINYCYKINLLQIKI